MRQDTYVLRVENPRPSLSAHTRTFTGTAETVKRLASEVLRTLAGRWGMSALALSWDLEVVA